MTPAPSFSPALVAIAADSGCTPGALVAFLALGVAGNVSASQVVEVAPASGDVTATSGGSAVTLTFSNGNVSGTIPTGQSGIIFTTVAATATTKGRLPMVRPSLDAWSGGDAPTYAPGVRVVVSNPSANTDAVATGSVSGGVLSSSVPFAVPSGGSVVVPVSDFGMVISLDGLSAGTVVTLQYTGVRVDAAGVESSAGMRSSLLAFNNPVARAALRPRGFLSSRVDEDGDGVVDVAPETAIAAATVAESHRSVLRSVGTALADAMKGDSRLAGIGAAFKSALHDHADGVSAAGVLKRGAAAISDGVKGAAGVLGNAKVSLVDHKGKRSRDGKGPVESKAHKTRRPAWLGKVHQGDDDAVATRTPARKAL